MLKRRQDEASKLENSLLLERYSLIKCRFTTKSYELWQLK